MAKKDSPQEVKPDDQSGNDQDNPTPEVTEANTDTPPESNSPTLSDMTASHAKTYEGFDPTIHAQNEDGSPKLKTDGSYALKRGRKAGSVAAALPPKNAPQKNAVGEPAIVSHPTISIDEAARQSANLVINAAVWTLGEEVGKPLDKGEADGLKLSFKNYYEARGVPDIPPEIGLFIAIGSYIGPRLMHEKSKTKLERIGSWIQTKLHK